VRRLVRHLRILPRRLRGLAARHPDKTFVWIDIEDQADVVGDLDVDNFPTLLMQRHDTGRLLRHHAARRRPGRPPGAGPGRAEDEELARLATSSEERRAWQRECNLRTLLRDALMASYQSQDQDHTVAVNPVTRAWVVGANPDVGLGVLLAGYGRKSPDGAVPTRQIGLGYEYWLSKRTFLYADASNRKAATSVNFYGVGIHHKFRTAGFI
jgi:hypothetical protein